MTAHKPFGRGGEIFGDAVVAPELTDRPVHRPEVIARNGDNCRLKNRNRGRIHAPATEEARP